MSSKHKGKYYCKIIFTDVFSEGTLLDEYILVLNYHSCCCIDVLQNIAAFAQVRKKSLYHKKPRQTLKGKHKNPKLKARRVYILFFDFVFKCLPQASQARASILNVGIIASEGWRDKSTETGALIKRDKQCERGIHAEMQESTLC